MFRSFRLWRARRFGPPVGEWTITKHTHVSGKLCARRVTERGDIQYRDLYAEEEMGLVADRVNLLIEKARKTSITAG